MSLSRRQSDALYALLPQVAGLNRGILPTREAFETWLAECEVRVFEDSGGVLGALSLSPSGEVGVILDPARKVTAMRRMLPALDALPRGIHAWVARHNSVVLRKAMQLGFQVEHENAHSYFLRRR